jgi:transposase
MVQALIREPGVGELTALRFLSHLNWDPSAFESAQQVAASVGYNPVKVESGTYKGRTTISKRGPGRLRAELYMATVVAVRFNPRIKAFYKRLLSKGLSKMAALTACSRKLCMVLYGILKAHLHGKMPIYGGEKLRYTNLHRQQRRFRKATCV